MTISDDEIKAHTNAAQLDSAIAEAFELYRKLKIEETDFLLRMQEQEQKIMATIGRLQALRTTLKIVTGA